MEKGDENVVYDQLQTLWIRRRVGADQRVAKKEETRKGKGNDRRAKSIGRGFAKHID
jgi:hypothetical protein